MTNLKILGAICLFCATMPLLFVQGEQKQGQPPISQIVRRAKQAYQLDTKGPIDDRRQAIDTLADFSNGIHDVIDTLLVALNDEDEQIRRNAANSLARMGPSGQGAIMRLTAMLEYEKAVENRLAAINGIASVYIGSRDAEDYAKKPIAALCKTMRTDSSIDVRMAACLAFRRIGRPASAAASDLILTIKDAADPFLARSACDSLGAVVGPENEDITPTLLQMYNKEPDDSVYPKGVILGSLARIGHKEEIVIPMLIEALKSDQMRATAANGLKRFGQRAKKGVPALISCLETSIPYSDPRIFAQWAVMDALSSIGPEAKAAIPILERIVKTDKDSRARAEQALKAIKAK